MENFGLGGRSARCYRKCVASAAALGWALGGLGFRLAVRLCGPRHRAGGRLLLRRRLAGSSGSRLLIALVRTLVWTLVSALGRFRRLLALGVVGRLGLGGFFGACEIALAFLVRFEIGFVPATALQAKHRRGHQLLERLLLAAGTLLQRRLGDLL